MTSPAGGESAVAADAQPRSLEQFRGELRPITGLRIIAALWVVTYHFHLLDFEMYPSFLGFLDPVTKAGFLGVDVFFVLSGFIITHTYLSRMGPRLALRPAGSFLWARLSRMWPAFAAVTTAYGLFIVLGFAVRPGVGWIGQTAELNLSASGYVQQLFLVHLWSRPTVIGSAWVGPGWSVSAEWAAYVLFLIVALLLWRLRHAAAPALAIGAIVLVAVYALTTTAWDDYAFRWFAQVMVEFIAGALIYLAIRRLQWTSLRHQIARWTLVVVVPVMVLALYLLPTSVGDGLHLSGLAVLITLLPLVIGAAGFLGLTATPSRRDYVTRILSSRAIVHGGRISYSLYLVHAPVNGVFQRLHAAAPWPSWGPLQLLPMATLIGISLLVAHLTWRFIEEPARLRLRKLDPFRVKPPATDRQRQPNLGE